MNAGHAEIGALVLRVASGDLAAFRELQYHPQVDQIRTIPLPDVALTRAALLGVLRPLRDDKSQKHLIELWALFMLRGYIDVRGSGPRVYTEHEIDMDELTIDILTRLEDQDDDYGDGPVTDQLIDEWIRQLESSYAPG